MQTVLITVVVGAVILFLLIMTAYNRLVGLRQNVRESWAAIDTELRRRFDLIPNLVETVKGYAGHERGTLEAVIQARNATSSASTIEAQVTSQNALSGALGKLMALSEAYPDLKANQQFMQLQQELSQTETRISQARRFYNANVKEFNMACEMFPTTLVASAFNFFPQPYFGLEDAEAAEPVKISFGGGGAADSGQRIKLKQDQFEDRS